MQQRIQFFNVGTSCREVRNVSWKLTRDVLHLGWLVKVHSTMNITRLDRVSGRTRELVMRTIVRSFLLGGQINHHRIGLS